MSNAIYGLEWGTLNLFLKIFGFLVHALDYPDSLLPLVLEVEHVEMFLLSRDGSPFLGDPSLELVPLSVNAGGRRLFSLLNTVDVSLLEALVVLKGLISHGHHFLVVFPSQ
jgi:hypothetical protein